jgi:hypothetical protein
MEKKGDVLNQLAIITDLIERVNIDTQSGTLIFGLTPTEFRKVFDLVQKKYNRKMDLPNDTFKITIGTVDVIFNMNSV